MHLGLTLERLDDVCKHQLEYFSRFDVRDEIYQALEGAELALCLVAKAEVDAQIREGAALIGHLLLTIEGADGVGR